LQTQQVDEAIRRSPFLPQAFVAIDPAISSIQDPSILPAFRNFIKFLVRCRTGTVLLSRSIGIDQSAPAQSDALASFRLKSIEHRAAFSVQGHACN
jgi:hypothetical protein